MDDDQAQPAGDRRSREAARPVSRQRRLHNVGTVLTLGIVAIVALVATDTLRVGANGPTLASGKTTVTTVATKSNPKTDVAKLKRKLPPRPLSHAAPLRLWIGGDSLAGELGFQLGPLVSKLGIVQAHVDYKVSSGLASNNVRNWPQRFTQEEAQYEPETVIFMVGANDASIVGSAVDASGTPTWETAYRTKVDAMMQLLVGAPTPRTVFWIGSPTLGTGYNPGAEEVDRVMREEAAKFPTVVYFDAFSLFASNGEYSSSLPDGQGNRILMRSSDGVHFTVKGAEYLAIRVYALLNARWNLAGQAAPATPIQYTIEPSNFSVGGVHMNRSNGSGGSNSGSATTTPPTTAAPAPTAPPTTAPHTTTPTTAPKTTTPPTSSPPSTKKP
jgi:hypothetical protein